MEAQHRGTAAGVVVRYDSNWVHLFEAERELHWLALEPWLVADIEHVGSTSVRGMAAKPVIDMFAGVHDLVAARAAAEPLLALNYRHRPHRPEAHLFDKPPVDDWRGHTHHLHLTEPGSDLWQERLVFRDALRSDLALVTEYNAWKRDHAVDRVKDEPYDETKWPFVSRVLAQRGVTLKPDALRRVRAEDLDVAPRRD